MKHAAILLAILFLTTAPSAASSAANTAQIERYYCTQFGPFFIRFDDDKAAGVFAILPNDDLGSIVGALSGRKLEGQWIETDSRGKIRLTFSEDWLYFDAEYTVHTEPEKWLANWSGRIRPAGEPATFDYSGVQYRCE